ncbi:transcriptional regulator ATRX homolog [Anopheles bellator]|uniref:transcriptional regulator ATRX homolog n=1 Tax=Anopheles bellator TaxID=139047 RepID=UPI0026476C79|nr:transcriptional regulator ATRX homolog [Anopheles bellator]
MQNSPNCKKLCETGKKNDPATDTGTTDQKNGSMLIRSKVGDQASVPAEYSQSTVNQSDRIPEESNSRSRPRNGQTSASPTKTPESLANGEERSSQTTTPTDTKLAIRLVSLERLLRPSLVNTLDAKVVKASGANNSSLRKSKRNISIIEISSSDDSESSSVISFHEDILNESANESTSTQRNKQTRNGGSPTVANGVKLAGGANQVREFSVKVQKLPTDLRAIKTLYGLKTICDHRNVEIESLTSDTNRYAQLRTKEAQLRIEPCLEAAAEEPVGVGKPQNRNDSDSDDTPLISKIKRNIPKQRKMARNSRKRRAVSDSEEDDGAENTGKNESPVEESPATTNGSDTSDEDRKENNSNGPETGNVGRKRRAAARSCRTNLARQDKSTDEEEKKDEGNEESIQLRKKRTRIRKNSSSSDEKKKTKPKLTKRRRIKRNSSGDSEGDSPNKGRKNIRKVLKKSDLEQTTKNAELEERERKQRVAERQKHYNQEAFDEKPEESRPLEQLVLDFDDDTKKPLLEVDKKLVKQLKPHQANGVKFMFDACFESLERMKESKGSGCILAHCMGLGKTLQVVALAHTLTSNSAVTGVERILVVCPLSTVLNWVNEFSMWMKHVRKDSEIEVYEISKYKDNVTRANVLMEWHNEGGVMILGYDMFRNLANPTAKRIRKKVRESLQTSLINPGPDLIVCDEGHLLKNEKTSLSQVVTRISTLRRIVLTGTPIQNNMKEYYCMVQFVKPKLLGTYPEYLNRFVNPITNGQYTDSTSYDIQLMRKRAHVLHKLLDGCVQRRDYSVLSPFLPPKLEFVLSIKLTPMQCTLYKHYMENFARQRQPDDPMQKGSARLFADFQNLQRIWTHPMVLRYNSDRYEFNQQKKDMDRDLGSEDESVGSMKDFLDDSDSEQMTSSGSSSDSEDDVQSVHDVVADSDSSSSSEDLSKSTSKKATTGSSVSTRQTRTNKKEVGEEPIELPKAENPTEWWMPLCPESELDNLEHSGKLLLLMEILKECETIGDKLLLFSQSLYALDVIEHFLSLLDENTQKKEEERNETLSKYPGSWAPGLDYFRLDGSTSIDNRNDACSVFNDESNTRARLFLISTRAGGLGINLVAANRVVIFDVSWNPSHDIQSIFRVYRFGQRKPCYVYRFIAMGTMEEKLYERQVTKQAISKRVIDEQQIDRHYKENDLQELYRYELESAEPRPTPKVPKDRLFAELLQRFDSIIFKYHEHDSLLENKEEETLDEEERKAAWEEFEQEKNRPPLPAFGMAVGNSGMGVGTGMGMGGRVTGPVTSNTTYGFRNDVLLKLLNMKARQDNPHLGDNVINTLIPYMMHELQMQMKEGELSLYRSLWDLYYQLEVPSQTLQSQSMGYAAGNAGTLRQAPLIHQPMMSTSGGTMAYVHPNQSGAPFVVGMPNQQPGISGLHQVNVAPAVGGPPTIDPNIVELD